MEWLKKIIRNYLKKHEGARKYVRKAHVQMKEKKYSKETRGLELDDKMVVFETFMGRQYGDNPRAIYEQMISDSRFDDFRFVWILNDEKKADAFDALERAETVALHSADYYKVMATAKYVVTNSNLDYGIKKRPGQIFLQTWHGTPLKRLRCDIEVQDGNVLNSLEEIRQKNDMDVVRYDYFISPSAFCTEKFTSAFNLKKLGKENIIIETGYPRNDMLFRFDDDRVSAIKKELAIPEGKKVLLYAPTFRDNQHDGSGYVYDTHLDFDRLRSELGDEWIVLFRAHYFVANQFDFAKYEGFVYNVSDYDDITPIYTVSDMLITDYSSVFFDFANLRRPMIFYMYDLEEYMTGIRGFYIDIDELPGPIVKEEEELIHCIKSESFEYDEKYKAFNDKYNYLDDGDASRRVVDIMMGKKN